MIQDKTIEDLIIELQEIKKQYGNIKVYDIEFFIEGFKEKILTI